MKNKEYIITDKTFIELIMAAYPQGAEYANKVMNLAVDLGEVAASFYCGAMLNDYGIYPFLNAEALCYAEGSEYSNHIIIRSEFDNKEFLDWVDGLSLSNEEKQILKSDVAMRQKDETELLDQSYLSILQYLIEIFKCIEKRKKERIDRLGEILKLPVNYSMVVLFDSIFTKKYLMRKMQKYNSKSSEKHFIMHEYPGMPLEKCVVMSCQKHISK